MPILKDAEITFRVRSKMEQIARLEVLGKKDAAIAHAFGMSAPGLAVIKARPEYRELREQILQGHLASLDQDDAVKRLLRDEGVPEAMKSVLEIVKQRKDLRLSLQASLELLDRDPDRRAIKATPSGSGGSGPQTYTVPGKIIDATLEASNKLVGPTEAPTKLAAVVN